MSIIWNTIDLSTYFDIVGITTDGTVYSSGFGLDSDPPGTGGNTFSGTYVPSTISWNGMVFNIAAANANDVISCQGQILTLNPIADLTDLFLLGTATNGPLTDNFTITYSDTSTQIITQTFSDWVIYDSEAGQYVVLDTPRRNHSDGTYDTAGAYIFGFDFSIESDKTPVSITLPNNNEMFLFALNEAEVTPAGGCTCGGVGPVACTYAITGSGGASCTGDTTVAAVLLTTDSGFNIITDDGRNLAVSYSVVSYDNSTISHNSVSPLSSGSTLSALARNGYEETLLLTGTADLLAAAADNDYVVTAPLTSPSTLRSGPGLVFNIVGSGGCGCGGTGTEHVHFGVVGSGGASGSGTGTVQTGIIHNRYIEVGSGGATGNGLGILVVKLGQVGQLLMNCRSDKKYLFVPCREAYIPVITRCNQRLIDIIIAELQLPNRNNQ